MAVYPFNYDFGTEEPLKQNSAQNHHSTTEISSFASVPQKLRVTSIQDAPLVMTPIEAARILGCGRNSIYSLLKSGKLKSIRVGKLIKITKSALEDYLQMR